MRIPLDREGGAPLYRQIADHLRQGIVRGSLEPGLRLPATRRLAGDLGVNRITVETAYAELQAEGLVAHARAVETRLQDYLQEHRSGA